MNKQVSASETLISKYLSWIVIGWTFWARHVGPTQVNAPQWVGGVNGCVVTYLKRVSVSSVTDYKKQEKKTLLCEPNQAHVREPYYV